MAEDSKETENKYRQILSNIELTGGDTSKNITSEKVSENKDGDKVKPKFDAKLFKVGMVDYAELFQYA